MQRARTRYHNLAKDSSSDDSGGADSGDDEHKAHASTAEEQAKPKPAPQPSHATRYVLIGIVSLILAAGLATVTYFLGRQSGASLSTTPAFSAEQLGGTSGAVPSTRAGSEYGERDPTVVKADIDNYNSWDGDLALDGVFVDELNPEYDDALNKYTQYSEWIRSGFGGSGYVMMNPGSNVDGSFYAISDMIISYESGYDKYDSSQIQTASDTPQTKQAIMIYGLPTDSAALATTLEPIAPSCAAVFMTDRKIESEDVYAGFGSNWDSFLSAVATRNGGAASKRRRREQSNQHAIKM